MSCQVRIRKEHFSTFSVKADVRITKVLSPFLMIVHFYAVVSNKIALQLSTLEFTSLMVIIVVLMQSIMSLELFAIISTDPLGTIRILGLEMFRQVFTVNGYEYI